MAKLVIYGAGVTARMAHYYFERDSDYEVVAFAVDRQYKQGDAYLGLPLVAIEDVSRLYPPSQHQMFVAMAYSRMNHDRASGYRKAKELGYSLVSYVSSHCTYLADQPPGENCFIFEDNTIQPFVKIGNNVTLWSGNHVGHDSVIEDHCFIASQVVISGFCRIGAYSFLGVNATLRDGIVVAPETLIGAGAVIMKDTQPKGVYLPPRAVLFSKTSDQIEI